MDLSPAARALVYLSRGVYLARALGRPAPAPPPPPRHPAPPGPPRRNILFITVDQQRYDALGITGNPYTRTPVLDALARDGVLYRRAHVQNVVCMPSRSTMLTGQHPRTHGVIANGISLPDDAPSVADLLARQGYRTALVGKAHFEPHLDPTLRFRENALAARGSTGPFRGFEHVELATHGPIGGHHYAAWLFERHPEAIAGFGAVLSGSRGGRTGAPEVKRNPVPRGWYHTDWVADRTLAWLRGLDPDDAFFCWVSFPDPHHPFDPPAEEVDRRGDYRDTPLPPGYPKSRERAVEVLRRKPRHWLDWYEGRHRNPEGGPVLFRPGAMTADQLREVTHMIRVENELIDEACGRILSHLVDAGLDARTDVIFTSDHGELQGDFGLLFKGPYHVESLLRVPLIWRPAPCADVPPAVVDEPVGHVDLAPTFCAIAGVAAPAHMEGTSLPTAPGSGRARVITTFDSQFAAAGMHLRTIYRDGMLCTFYEKSTDDVGGRFPFYWAIWGHGSRLPRYVGTEGELYDLRNDPLQHENLWDDGARRGIRDALVEELVAALPPARTPPLRVDAPT